MEYFFIVSILVVVGLAWGLWELLPYIIGVLVVGYIILSIWDETEGLRKSISSRKAARKYKNEAKWSRVYHETSAYRERNRSKRKR